jgi:hypothetical protein
MTARTAKLERAYQKAKSNGGLVPLYEETSLKDWTHWKLVQNRFPHNKIVTKHQMVVLKREANIWAIKQEELIELWYVILPWADERYHFAKINLVAMRSINAVPHIHLCDYQDRFI